MGQTISSRRRRGRNSWSGFVGSESDIELVAVSSKFDFSERRNVPNKEMDPDRKLLNGFRGLDFLLTAQLF